MDYRKWLPLVGFVIVAWGCSFSPPKSIVLNFSMRGPGSLSGFKCFGLNVVGEGIPSITSSIPADWQSVAQGRTCTYPGSSTVAQKLPSASETASQTEINFSLKISPGKSRVFQVIGIDTTGECPREKIETLIEQTKLGTLAPEIQGMYEVGRAVADVYRADTIAIQPNYVATTAYNLKDCYPAEGSSGGLAISPSSLTMAPGDRYYFKATGGTPPYKYYAVEDPAFGSIDRDSGLFIASTGPPTNMQVKVVDFAGGERTASVRFFSPSAAGALAYWYRASQFLAVKNDGDDVASDLTNQGFLTTVALQTAAATGGNRGVVFRNRAGPNGFPTLEIYSGYGYSYTGAAIALTTDHSIYMVARRSAPQPGVLFCIGVSAGCPTATASRLFWSDTSGVYQYLFRGDGSPDTLPLTPANDTRWNLISAAWDGNSGPNHVRFAIGDQVLLAPSSSANFMLSGGSIGIGMLGGVPNQDFIEFAELLVYEAGGLPAALEPYLAGKYGITIPPQR